jgi:hypothetical protein
MQNEAAQSRDEPSATSARVALAAAPVETSRAAVGDDDQVPAGAMPGPYPAAAGYLAPTVASSIAGVVARPGG